MDDTEGLQAIVDSLGAAVVVAGCGAAGGRAAERFDAVGDGDGPAATRMVIDPSPSPRPTPDVVADRASDAAAVLVLTEPGDTAAVEVARAMRAAGAFVLTVAAVPPWGPSPDERAGLDAVREAGDGVLVVPTGDPTTGLREAARALVSLVGRSELVNLDLADVRTVLDDGGDALLLSGEAAGVGNAVAAALRATPPEVDVGGSAAALVHFAGDPSMGVAATGDAIERVRERLADGAHIIWGAAVEPGEGVIARLLVAGVRVEPAGPSVCAGCDESVATLRAVCPHCGQLELAFDRWDTRL